MGILDSVFGSSTPVNRDEMLAICDEKIRAGHHEEAARVAQTYKNRVIDSNVLSDEQKSIDAGYAWYMLAKSVYRNLQTNPAKRMYEIYKGFFAAHRMGYWCFQNVLMVGVLDWDKSSEHYPYVEELDSFYDELYRLLGDDPDLERADADANDAISSARRL